MDLEITITVVIEPCLVETRHNFIIIIITMVAVFAVAGPTIWNSLPEYLHSPELSIDNFRRQLKTFLFAQY